MEIIAAKAERRVKTKIAGELKPRDVFRFDIGGWTHVVTDHVCDDRRYFTTIKGDHPNDVGATGWILKDGGRCVIPLIDGEPEYVEGLPDGAEECCIRDVHAGEVFQCDRISKTAYAIMDDEGGCTCGDGTWLSMKPHMDAPCIVYRNATLYLGGKAGA